MPESQQDPWERLGELLIRRRVGLDPVRFRNRKTWVKHTQEDYGLKFRVVVDIETGARRNFKPATIATIERAYRLQPGAVQAVLAGADHLAPLEDEGPWVIGEDDGVRTVQATIQGPEGARQVILPIDLYAIPGLEHVDDEEREQLIQQAIGAATHAAQQFLEAQGQRKQREAPRDTDSQP